MQTTISLNAILDMLRPLSVSNKKWLADRLYEQAVAEEKLTVEHVRDADVSSKIAYLRGIAKGITSQQIEQDDRLAYILSK